MHDTGGYSMGYLAEPFAEPRPSVYCTLARQRTVGQR